MPNRILREGLRASEAINSLSDAAERLYVRLLVSADDFGLIELRATWAKALAVPLLDWSLPTVSKLLVELVDNGLLIPYTVDGKAYAAIARWSQRIEAKRPKFPLPPWGRDHIIGGLDRSGRDRSRTSGGMPSGRPVDAHEMPTPEERGTRNEDKNPTAANAAVAGADGAPPCPHREILALYAKHLPMGVQPKASLWNGTRARHLQARWREDPERQSLDWWDRFFDHCSKSPFLTGHVPPGKGHTRPFVVSIDWLLEPRNFAAVVEGRYDEVLA